MSVGRISLHDNVKQCAAKPLIEILFPPKFNEGLVLSQVSRSRPPQRQIGCSGASVVMGIEFSRHCVMIGHVDKVVINNNYTNGWGNLGLQQNRTSIVEKWSSSSAVL